MFRLSAEPIDAAALQRALAAPGAGACVTFEGWVRDHHAGRPVTALEYEAFGDLAAKEGARILAEARAATVDLPPIEFRVTYGLGDDLRAQEFDAVIGHELLMQFDFDELLRFCSNIFQTLKPGGIFVSSVYTFDDTDEIAQHMGMIKNHGAGARSPFRVHRMPRQTYRDIFEACGFEIVDEQRSRADEYQAKKTPHTNFVLRRPAN